MSERPQIGLDSELLGLPAGELARRIRAREVSPVEAVESALRQAERVQAEYNAFTVITASEALSAARRAEEAIVQGRAGGPLHGVPFTVKDMIPVKGQRITFGSCIFEDWVAGADALVVERLRAAGAVLIGITSMPEFGHKATNDSPLHGITRNPWDRTRTPGGSSGGAAVAVCTGAGAFALGTDGAGSVRIPAACCGVVGLKGTLGTVPNPEAADAFGSLIVTGPLTRTVADAHLVMQVLSGAHPHDPLSYRAGGLGPLPEPRGRLAGQRVLWVPSMGNALIDEEVLALTARSVHRLESMGASVTEMPLDLTVSAELLFVINPSLHYARFGRYLESHGDRLDPSFRQSIEWGASLSGAQLQSALFQRTELFRRIQDLLSSHDLIVSPTLSAPALPVEQQAWEPVEIGGRTGRTARYEWFSYTHPFNHAGNPAVSIPCGWTASGLPVGLQIAGRWHAESEVLTAAAELEAAQPWRDRYPGVDRD